MCLDHSSLYITLLFCFSIGRLDRAALDELQTQCQEFRSLYQATEVERDRLAELVQVMEKRSVIYRILPLNGPYLHYRPPPNFGKSRFFCTLYLMFVQQPTPKLLIIPINCPCMGPSAAKYGSLDRSVSPMTIIRCRGYQVKWVISGHKGQGGHLESLSCVHFANRNKDRSVYPISSTFVSK